MGYYVVSLQEVSRKGEEEFKKLEIDIGIENNEKDTDIESSSFLYLFTLYVHKNVPDVATLLPDTESFLRL